MTAASPTAGLTDVAPAMPKLSIRDLSLSYRTNRVRQLALDGINLDLAEREFVAIVGPSGCGKSTLLKIIAGLATHTVGDIYIDGQNLGTGVPRGVGMVFQNDALLPWRTVQENVRLPLVISGIASKDQGGRVVELLELVGLAGYADYFPRQLSGGMRKRVALARTMAYDPQLYLMDEPFGPLDAQTRIRIGGEFLKIWERVGKSVLFVTHDVEEAIALADRVVVMTAGPGRIKSEHLVPIPRPRDFEEVRFTDEFHRIRQQIWHELQSEPLPDSADH